MLVKTNRWLVSALAPVLWTAKVAALPVPLSLTPCGSFEVARVVSGDELEQADGTRLLLAAIKAPEMWQPDDQYRSWPHANESQEHLARLVGGSSLALFCEGERETFDGKTIAHALTGNGHWLQHELVVQGSVLVLPRPSHQAGLDTLYAAESIARQRDVGLWNKLDLMVSADDDIQTGSLKLVTGKVLSANRVANRVYLNFGEDWQRDFTVEIPRRAVRFFEEASIDPLELNGKTVEARGWVTWRGGPHMLIDGPGQLTIAEPSPEQD